MNSEYMMKSRSTLNFIIDDTLYSLRGIITHRYYEGGNDNFIKKVVKMVKILVSVREREDTVGDGIVDYENRVVKVKVYDYNGNGEKEYVYPFESGKAIYW